MHGTPSPSAGHEQPPSYDAVTHPEVRQAHVPIPPIDETYKPDDKQPLPDPYVSSGAGPSMPSPTHHMVPSGPMMPATLVYNYVNPNTGDHVASLLPPNHPAMVCLQEGRHINQAHYGVLGVLAAVFWFPLGIGLCLLDRRVKCRRCGQTVSSGLCD